MKRWLLGEWTPGRWLQALLFGVVVFLMVWILAHAVTANASAPVPENKTFYCLVHGRKVQCWCDVWLHYPLCLRWHWK